MFLNLLEPEFLTFSVGIDMEQETEIGERVKMLFLQALSNLPDFITSSTECYMDGENTLQNLDHLKLNLKSQR